MLVHGFMRFIHGLCAQWPLHLWFVQCFKLEFVVINLLYGNQDSKREQQQVLPYQCFFQRQNPMMSISSTGSQLLNGLSRPGSPDSSRDLSPNMNTWPDRGH